MDNVGRDDRKGFVPVFVGLHIFGEFVGGLLALKLDKVGFDAGRQREVAAQRVVQGFGLVVGDDHAAGNVFQHFVDGQLAGDLGFDLFEAAALVLQRLHEGFFGHVLILDLFQLSVDVVGGGTDFQAGDFVDDGAVGHHFIEHGFVNERHLFVGEVADAVALDERTQVLLQLADAQLFAVDLGDHEIAGALIVGVGGTARAVHESDGSGEDDDKQGENPLDLSAKRSKYLQVTLLLSNWQREKFCFSPRIVP